MDDDSQLRISTVVGIFVLSCLALAFTFGLDSIIACIIGLVVIALILQLLSSGAND